MPNYSLLNNSYLVESLTLYIERGVPTGGFLNAVLCNDLREASGRADVFNKHRIFELVQWLYNEAPSPCWGSPENVEAWLARFTKPLSRTVAEIDGDDEHGG